MMSWCVCPLFLLLIYGVLCVDCKDFAFMRGEDRVKDFICDEVIMEQVRDILSKSKIKAFEERLDQCMVTKQPMKFVPDLPMITVREHSQKCSDGRTVVVSRLVYNSFRNIRKLTHCMQKEVRYFMTALPEHEFQLIRETELSVLSGIADLLIKVHLEIEEVPYEESNVVYRIV